MEIQLSDNPPKTMHSAFEQTQWSMIIAAAKPGDNTESREALETLCRRYWQPLYGFIRQQGRSDADAQDLVQEFFAQLLSSKGLQNVQKGKGRFRSFLLRSVKNFLTNDWKRANAQKRGGGLKPLSIDPIDEEHPGLQLPTTDASPDREFDKQWAITVLNNVLANLKSEQEANDKTEQFELLHRFIIDPESAAPQKEIADKLGLSIGAVKQLILRMRQRYRKLIWEEIASTVDSESDTQSELDYLIATLRS